MGSLAEMALEHARRRISGKPAKAPTSKASKISTPAPAAKPRSLEVVVTGPINHFMFLEGRSWAVDMVASLRAAPADVVIERLTGATFDRPGSYAAGIQSVINELKGAGSA
ncbi:MULTISPECIES: hypothetical protein [unclassified Pseudomonas]|uniref:hypothetical protein n=1 Tax=unclassified Pseudomonas TaxID=196821 RepID=UPI002096D166|nr:MULTISPECIES: hypothetical protein [unclassified Pseudomonas]MCO7519406.1 hypothetical protein [Pseudomonas sp. 1]MCO7541812.1 hypothetical protein [Pseudomonas sp. VA159-2]